MTPDDALHTITRLAAAEHWLAVLVTTRPDGEPGVSVVNAGILTHPVTGDTTLACVSRGRTAKLTNLRTHPRATLVFRSGWEWISATGPVDLAGPDDPHPDIDDLPQLLRDIYTAAGGKHPNLDEYDRVMREDRRTALLLRPTRYTTNPHTAHHQA
ncbi:pyridoxamine 5'-phosphate oxidase family protein [Actinokineospora enzanensis]|uniref:pyridoxamine 5'-phosphate oxidase family protein n=1 Tax=Actinokineospora enzanensis TaxID=155975 RepID=UPI000374469D|nr:pyridoxamine 5'-phosphate oxidase family protein [Actinokineospora enzanensis]